MEISLLKQIAENLNIKPYSRVYVEKIQNPSLYQVDFVELTFKKQFFQRGNMWKFKKSMCHRSVYMKQQVVCGGVNAQIQELAYNTTPLVSGIITENTHFIFRSRSTRIIWLVVYNDFFE